MKDHRHGDFLWIEWFGEGYEEQSDSDLIYYTEEIVDIEVPLIQRALASALQRDGVVDSLNDGFNAIHGAHVGSGYMGHIGGDIIPTACDEQGYSSSGEKAESPVACTWVEIPPFA